MTEVINETDLDAQEQVQEQMAGGIPGELSSIINRHLGNYVYPRKLGRVFGAQTDFVMPKTKNPRKPDVAFVSLERMPINTRDAVPVVPDLAVEVVSKTDDLYSIEDKAFFYLRSGMRLVWVVRPVAQVIEVYQAGQPPKLLTIADELDGGSVLPGFKLRISDIFGEVIGGFAQEE